MGNPVSEKEVINKILKIIKKWPTDYFANIDLDKVNSVPSAINGSFKDYVPPPSVRSLFFNPMTEIEIVEISNDFQNKSSCDINGISIDYIV